jgi:hypothetical protein
VFGRLGLARHNTVVQVKTHEINLTWEMVFGVCSGLQRCFMDG